MGTSNGVERVDGVIRIDAAQRLRYIDEKISATLDRRARAAEADAASAAAALRQGPAAQPRQVRVFLRSTGERGCFAELTVTHPAMPRPRSAPTI